MRIYLGIIKHYQIFLPLHNLSRAILICSLQTERKSAFVFLWGILYLFFLFITKQNVSLYVFECPYIYRQFFHHLALNEGERSWRNMIINDFFYEYLDYLNFICIFNVYKNLNVFYVDLKSVI